MLQTHNTTVSTEATSEGEKIALRRKRLGWKQQVLADKAGVGITTVVQIEKDRSVTTEKLRAVTAALDAAERKKRLNSDLSRHTVAGQSDPSTHGGADVPASDDSAVEALRRVESYLTPLLEDVRRIIAAHTTQGRGQSRKQG